MSNIFANAGSIQGKMQGVEINLRSNLNHMPEALIANEDLWHSIAADLLTDIGQLEEGLRFGGRERRSVPHRFDESSVAHFAGELATAPRRSGLFCFPGWLGDSRQPGYRESQMERVMGIKMINSLYDFKASRASHKTLIAVSNDGRYRLTAEKCPAGIEFEICDEQAPSSASTDVVYYGGHYPTAIEKLRGFAGKEAA